MPLNPLCSYLPEEQATTLFLDPSQPMDVHVYADLSEMGFRRSGDHLYRPIARTAMPACLRASPCDVHPQPPAETHPQTQCRPAGTPPGFSEEYFDLYQRYIEQRHADGDMYPPSRDQFSTFLVRDLPFSRFYEFRLDGRLLAVAVTDLLPNGLSAVYTFYEPDEERRSLGRFAILWQIGEARAWGWMRCTWVTGSRTAKR
jgi:arginine-tRNA-protein transferase